ncbi:MAG: aminotransferase class V-fold PLP-dependent enzyme [Nitrospinae bacterium]|nr:aminotransferase class V-fold PLP-dependent enzyme [Nitrospinota bacterium]
MRNKLVYLDNAATSHPKPATVINAVGKAIAGIAGSPGRGGHKGSLAAARMMFSARETIAEFFGLSCPERIVFTRNATEGLNIAIKGLIHAGHKVAISRLEHNSVIRPIMARKNVGVDVDYAPCDNNGLPDIVNLPDVDYLVTTSASNVTGAVINTQALASACRKKNIKLILDAAQSAGSIPLNAKDVDVLVCSGHKGLLGPQGIGFVYFAPGMEPDCFLEGGTGSDSESERMPDIWPDKFEAGTPNVPGVAGLKAGIEYIKRMPVAKIRQKELATLKLLISNLKDMEGVTVYGPGKLSSRAGLVSFNVAGIDPSIIADELDSQGVAVRAGLHCAPEAHKFIGSFPQGSVRVSPGPFTALKDINIFIEAMRRILKKKR